MKQTYYIIYHFLKPDERLATAWELNTELELDLDVAEDLFEFIKQRQAKQPTFALLSWKKLSRRPSSTPAPPSA